MAELIFFSGTMDCGKSTLALQMDHNYRQRGRSGLRFSCNDRAGLSVISSRLGPRSDAIEVGAGTDLWAEIVGRRTHGESIDYLICDEVQFYAPVQIEQLARAVDEMNVDVFAFGIATDFQTRLFPGSQRLIELADRVQLLQLEALCWCGRRATHNARTVDGVMVVEGAQVAVGDVEMGLGAEVTGGEVAAAATGVAAVGYETLCRRHYMGKVTAHSANLAGAREAPLPFDVPDRA